MKTMLSTLALCLLAGICVGPAGAQDPQGAAPATSLDLRNTVTGEPLDLSFALPEGRDTEAVKTFLTSGKNPYDEDASCLPKAQEIFLSACSGCHGEVGEGKIGPGLNDDYWTYPKNQQDQGLFETVYGGANAQMGPQYLNLQLDEMLLVMSWVRHLYTGKPDTAVWLPEARRASFQPYSKAKPLPAGGAGLCKAK